MKALVATIALLCMSSSVLAHDIYSDLRDRDGNLCCSGQDCKPVQATVLPDGNYYLPASGEPFPPKWQHHHRMIASTIVPIIKCILGLNPGVIHYGTPRPRLDASLLRCTLPSRALHAFQLRQQPLRFLLRRPASDHRLRYLLLCLAVELVNSPWSKPASEAICSGRPGQRLVRLRQ